LNVDTGNLFDDIVDSRHSETEPELLQENKNDIVGNKILHCGKLMDMFNKFYKEHGQNEPRCELSFNWNTNNCQKWGLSWHLGLKCDNCTCTVVLLTYIPAFCMALNEGTGMSADKNNARRPSTPSGELWSPT
jgi:hypothetical protein